VRFTLQKAVARRAGLGASAAAPTGELICVLGPKGGVGKTQVASNLAVTLADGGNRVALVDLDLQFGDVGLALALAPERTIYDLATSSGSLDSDKLEAFLMRHESGVRALLAPTRPDQAATVRVDFLKEVFAMLRSTSEYVIVDTPPGFTPEVITSVDSSSNICMVAALDSLSLKNTRLGLEALELMGYEPERIKLVLNRADTRVGVTGEDAAAVLGREPNVLVPSHRDVVRSVNDGSPIALADRRSEAAKAFRSLAAMFATSVAPEPASSNGRRLGLRRRNG
jgi:pilus assembly protein CpaE